MKSIRGKNLILAVAFSALLLMSSGAQAGSSFVLEGNPAERQVGLFQQALHLLSGAWTDLVAVFSADETATTSSTTCTDPNGCGNGDSGWTIDPEG